MRALSLTQPWATLVALGLKPVENRKWRPGLAFVGHDFAVHASAKFDFEGAAWIEQHFRGDPVVMDALNGKHPQSAILGVVRLAGYMHAGNFYFRGSEEGEVDMRQREGHPLMHDKWFFGKFGYVLDEVRTLPNPVIGVKGALNFWTVKPEIEKEVGDQLEALARTVRRMTTPT